MLMNEFCDLHTHSTKSDGTFSPIELIFEAKRLGLAAIALTDHDTIAGIAEALAAADEHKVNLICGIELSIECDGLPIENASQRSIHVLSYFNRENIFKMAQYEEMLLKNRHERNLKMIEKSEQIGMPITMDELRKYTSGKIISKGHFYRVLVEKGYAKDKDDAFARFLEVDGLIFVKKRKITPKEAVELVNSNGGIAVVAHPLLIGLSDFELENTVTYLKEIGFAGLEAVYVESSPSEIEKVTKLAKRHGMFITGGSDFHGEIKATIAMGSGYGDLRVPKVLGERLAALL